MINTPAFQLNCFYEWPYRIICPEIWCIGGQLIMDFKCVPDQMRYNSDLTSVVDQHSILL